MAPIKNIILESGSLTGTDGFDSIVGSNITLGAPILKGFYTASVSVTAALSSYGQEDFTATNNVYMSVYVRVSAVSTSNFIFCDIRDAGGNTLVRVRITSTGAFRLEVGGATVGTDFAATIGTMYRIGLVYNKGTGANAVGQMFVAVGDAAFGAAHASTSSSALTAQATRIRCGVTSSGAIVDLVFDNLRIDDATMPAADPTPTASHVMLGGSHLPLMLGVYTAPRSGTLLTDLTPFAQGVTITTGEHGFEELSATVPRSFAYAYQLWAPQGRVLYVVLTNGAEVVWVGRLNAPELWSTVEGSGVRLVAYGLSHALDDAVHTALWSTTLVNAWRPIISTEVSVAVPDRYTFDTNNQIYIAPNKNATLGTTTANKYGLLGFLAPHNGSRAIIGAQFDFTFVAPAANWRVALQTRDASFAGIANPWLISSTGAGTTTGSVHVTFADAQIVNFAMDFNAADATFTGETGSAYLRITNLRLVTVTTNRVNTTLTVARTNGTNVVANVGSSTGMYVGQRLFLSGGSKSESVLITAVNSGQFTATFANAPAGGYPIGTTVQAHVVYADDIVKALLSAANTLNSGQLSTSTALIQSPGLDLVERTYEDMRPSDILNDLISVGDNQIPPRQWEWQVWEDGALAFRPESTAGATWLIEATDIQLQRTNDDLANSVYATYRNASGETRRTSTSTDTTSVAAYGLTRQFAVSSDSSSSIEALVRRDAVKIDQKDPLPRASFTFAHAARAGGAIWPNALMRTGDTLTIQNIPPELSASVDKVRTFRIGGTSYNCDDDSIQADPEATLKLLEFLLARRAAGF